MYEYKNDPLKFNFNGQEIYLTNWNSSYCHGTHRVLYKRDEFNDQNNSFIISSFILDNFYRFTCIGNKFQPIVNIYKEWFIENISDPDQMKKHIDSSILKISKLIAFT